MSLILHSDRKRKYNIYILHTDIELQSQKNFQKELQRENIKIIFLDVSWRIEGYRLKAKQHITSETYYRFLILDIFKNYNKVLYLDCDMIICKDVAELYDIDLEDKWLGAVVDPDFAGQCNGANVDTANYVKDVLKLENPFRYFQAGVLILNPKTLNSNVSMQQLFEMSEDDKYMYSDQDILNIVCENNVKYLDMKWNLLPDARNRWRNVIKYAPYYILDEYESARKEPYIIHYAGDTKPWKNPGEDYAPEFWKVAKQTEYYEVLIQKIEKPKEKHISFLENFKISIKNSVKRMLPKDSKIRKIIFTLYWKMK